MSDTDHATHHDSWQAYFGPGEQLLWEGQPEPGIHFQYGFVVLSAFGLPFLMGGLATAGMGMATVVSGGFEILIGLFMLLFSLPFLGIGAGLAMGPWLAGPIANKRVRYALTNRRAYIASNILRRRMQSFEITAASPVELEEGQTDSVFFARRTRRDGERSFTSRVGFRNIRDGRRVHAMLREIQQGSRDD